MDIDKAWAGEDAEQAEDVSQAEDAEQAEEVQTTSPKASSKTAKRVSQKAKKKTKKNKTSQKAKPNNKAKTNNKMKPEEKAKLQPASPPMPTQKKKDSPILGEDDSELDDGDDEIESDEDDVAPSRPKDISQGSDQKKLSKSEIDKENKKNKKRAEKRNKLLEGFRQAEEFHKTWFNLPTEKIKPSHEKLIKFCKVACTKKNCMDDQVANHCHLMCPVSTTKQCPDPLKLGDTNTDEVTIGGEEASADMPKFTDDLDVKSSIEEAEKVLKESEGEGG